MISFIMAICFVLKFVLMRNENVTSLLIQELPITQLYPDPTRKQKSPIPTKYQE